MALSWRIFLISLLIAILALTSLSFVVSSWVNDMLRETSLRRLADSVNRETRLLQRSLDILKSDVLVLADLESVSAIARAAADPSGQGGIGPGAQRERLAQTFETLFGRRPSYTQVRLISAFQDGRELVQVFQNLIENAVQACPEGGRVSIATRMTAPDRFEISIADSGEGIATDIRDKVFEPFFTTRSKGTGLGLAVVRRVVKEHGGSVDLEPGPQGGTVATVCLPLASPVGAISEIPTVPTG